MFQSERQQEILTLLKEKGGASVKYLAEVIHTSPSSIRRDLTQMESMGLVKRSYGGVSLLGGDSRVLPIALRETENHREKCVIAQKAATLLKDGDTILLDWSTTAQHITLFLASKRNLRAFTNNIKTCRLLKEVGIDTFSLGGHFLYDAVYTVGPMTEQALEGIRSDRFFFSALCFSPEGDIYEPFELEMSLRKKMLERATVKVFMVDSSKFYKTSTYRIGSFADCDYVISNKPIDEKLKNKFPHTVFLDTQMPSFENK